MNSQDHKNSTNGLGYLIDDCYLLHDPGKLHPESPKRLVAIRQTLQDAEVDERWHKLHPRKASLDELALVHSPAHIEHVEQAAKCAPANLDSDTSVSMESFEIALFAAGGVLQCIDQLCWGRLRRIFAFVRPPGHHAGRESARGFCLFNNVAVAAAYAHLAHKLDRIAIVDFDVHHGNGTQSIFYNSSNILYISSHQYPFYPGSGSFSEVGRGAGRGYTLNFPLPRGAGDSNFVPIYSKIIPAVLEQFLPQLILVSAGFDGHYRDPLGGLSLTQNGYASAAGSLMAAAERLCEGRICFVLEGGYSTQALRDCIGTIIVEMGKHYFGDFSSPEGSVFPEISKQAAQFASDFWKW
jgi:acetoin utilization deacetylase AcuC-like enzyme